MFDKNNMDEFDLMLKSILDEAQEKVPERVWEGVSAGLDKAARRKTVALWWRRAAAGVAAAAVVALGVMLTHNGENELVPEATEVDMIAVVEPVSEDVQDETDVLVSDEADVTEVSLLAEVRKEDVHITGKDEESIPSNASEVPESIDNESVVDDSPSYEAKVGETDGTIEIQKPVEYFPEDWGEEEKKAGRGISLVVSGITGTNNALSQERLSPMMRPSVTPAPQKTGIDETSTKSSYGVPLSFGAGVKFDLSPRWSIGTGLNYTYLARQFYGKYTKVSPAGDIESVTSSDIRNRQHYIGIPVNVYYNIINNDRINFYAYAGGAVEKCVSDSYHLLSTDITHNEKIAGVQLSADAGIGVEFMLGKHLGLYLDPSIRYYFENTNQPKSIRTVQPLMLGFEMGLRARL